MENTPHTVWIIGCGDIGCRLADLYQKPLADTSKANTRLTGSNTSLQGIVRSEASRQKAELHGVEAHLIDLEQSYRLPLDQFDQSLLYYFAPPPKQGKLDTTLATFLSSIKGRPERIVMISTTGVYGDSKGEWIDEQTPLAPKADRAFRRASAEQQLQDWAEQYQRNYMILRVPGIYALDRLPLERLRKGLPVVNVAEAGYTNRIHADDLARICKTAMESPLQNRIFNATDGSPSTMTDYFNRIADFAGLPRPPQISLQEAADSLSEGMVSYLKESRRIRNDRMLKELGITLLYPNLQTFIMHSEKPLLS